MTELTFTPRPYQAEAVARILDVPGGGFGLFVEPGGGKTVTALTAADILMHDQMRVGRTLVVAPRLVAQEVWHRETAKWAHLSHLHTRLITFEDFGYKRITRQRRRKGFEFEETLVLPADPRTARRALLDSHESIHVISRDHLMTLVKLLGAKGQPWPYDALFGDESTSFKTHTSERSRALRYLRRHDLVKILLLLSGTPSPKGLEQLWAQVLALDNGERLGTSLTAFREEYMRPVAKGKNAHGKLIVYKWAPQQGATEAVMGKVSDICMSVRAKMWRENEEPNTVQKIVTLGDEARAAYDTMLRDSVLRVGTGAIAVNAGVLHGKLAQIASGAVFDRDHEWHLIHDEKLDALEEIVEELNGEPVMVLYWFKPSLARLKKRFPDFIDTETPGFIDKFVSGKAPGLFLNLAKGHGIDGLQHGGHQIVVFDLQADYELYKQSVDRLDRSGQQHQVTIMQLIAAGTVDEQIAPVLADRHADQGQVLDAIAFGIEKAYEELQS